MRILFQILFLIFVIIVAAMGVIMWILQPPKEFEIFKGEGYSFEIPVDSEVEKEVHEGDGWRGHVFKGYGRISVYYYTPGHIINHETLESNAHNVERSVF